MRDRSIRKPRVLAVDAERPDPASVAEAVRVLREGGLVAFPTETVYGLGARAFDREAIGRVFAAKGRPRSHPLIAHVTGEAEAQALARGWNERAALLARTFWPGPLTLVVERAGQVPAELAGGGDSIAVRAPVHPVARALIAALGEPVAAPSANRYQSISPTAAAHVVKSLGDAVDLVLDGGACPGGIESTVVDARGPRLRLLRPGGIDLPTLRAVAGEVEVHEAPVQEGAAHVSPGMDARHYAPHGRMFLIEGLAQVERVAREHASADRKVAIVAYSRQPESIPGVRVHLLPSEPKGYERALFATLHACDDEGAEIIVVESPPDDDERWLAARDRLQRAST